MRPGSDLTAEQAATAEMCPKGTEIMAAIDPETTELGMTNPGTTGMAIRLSKTMVGMLVARTDTRRVTVTGISASAKRKRTR